MVRLRREWSEDSARSTTEAHAEDWRAAIRSIADVDECPQYAGLELSPQVGLVPLHRDPESGLWEFWHVQAVIVQPGTGFKNLTNGVALNVP